MYSRVYVEITNICNMHCSFCHGHSRPFRQLQRQEFAKLLEQLKGKTQYIYYHLMGEPLTHPQLPTFLTMAKEAGFRSVLTTNGTLLHRVGLKLLTAGLHKVSISLHSFEEGSVRDHEEYLCRCASFAREAAAAGVLVSFRLWNKGCDAGQNENTLALLRSFLPGDWIENTRGYRIMDKVFLEWGDRFGWPDAQGADLGDRVYCYGLKDHFGILCDGTVVPCCLDSDGAINLGNAFSQPLEEILASPRAQAIREGFRQRHAAEDLCRRCPYARKF